MKLFTLIALVLSFNVFAQTSFKKLTKDNISSFQIGAAPKECKDSDRYTKVAVQQILVSLRDNSQVIFNVEGTDSDSSSGDNTDYASCSDALRYLKLSLQSQSLALFSLQSGDISSTVSDGKVLCTVDQINVMLDGNIVQDYKRVSVPVKCP